MASPNPCLEEFDRDEYLRSQVALRFSDTVIISASDLSRTSGPKRLSAALRSQQHLFVHEPMLRVWPLLEQTRRRPFRLCFLPRETATVGRLSVSLEQSLGFRREETLCIHWRGEDFHHPTQVLRYRQNTTSPTRVAARTLQVARRHGCTNALILSNARFEGVDALLRGLQGGGLRAKTARSLSHTVFGCNRGFVYGVYAEMLACSKAHSFLGSRKSQFSNHIVAMREVRGEANGTVHWL